MSDTTAIRALNALENGDWDGAHSLAQDDSSKAGAWIHAHLHRVEGDEGNARYWYSKAGREPATGDLDAERAAIRAELLG